MFVRLCFLFYYCFIAFILPINHVKHLALPCCWKHVIQINLPCLYPNSWTIGVHLSVTWSMEQPGSYFLLLWQKRPHYLSTVQMPAGRETSSASTWNLLLISCIVFCISLDSYFRSLELVYQRPGVMNGIPLYRYVAPKTMFANGTDYPPNEGFCPCRQSGLLNVSSCRHSKKVESIQLHYKSLDLCCLDLWHASSLCVL